MRPLLLGAAILAVGLSGCQSDLDEIIPEVPETENDIGLYLNLSTPPEHVADLGLFEVVSVTENTIRFSSSEGSLCDPVLYDQVVDNFNYDGLYQIITNGEAYHFRHGGQDCSGPETSFSFVNWANGRIPTPGTWEVSVVNKDIDQQGHTSLVTIGDSNTWWLHAQTLRARLDQIKPDYVFVGPHTDGYGYGHAAEGGDRTTSVISRLDKVPSADSYLMNIGTNDRVDPSETMDNIKVIVAELLNKNPNAVVYLCTLIPRTDEWDARSQAVSQEIRSWEQTQPNVMLVDLDSEFRAIPDWESLMLPDQVHPSDEGYVELARIIADRL